MINISAEVTKILKTNPVNRIDFKIDLISVNQNQMIRVANAIDNNLIEVNLGSSGTNFAASYTSWKTRKQIAGQQKMVGKITISENALHTQIGKAAIFHECIHALMDVAGYKPGMRKDEAVAYLADALYMETLKIKVSQIGLVGALYNAANKLINSKNMIKNPGTVLTWSDCDALLAAIKAIPEYS